VKTDASLSLYQISPGPPIKDVPESDTESERSLAVEREIFCQTLQVKQQRVAFGDDISAMKEYLSQGFLYHGTFSKEPRAFWCSRGRGLVQRRGGKGSFAGIAIERTKRRQHNPWGVINTEKMGVVIARRSNCCRRKVKEYSPLSNLPSKLLR
jgi:hypothetical protein